MTETTTSFPIDHVLRDGDLEVIHAALAQTYWSANIPYDVVATAFKRSSVAIARDPSTGKPVAWSRMVTDYATFGYIADVFVLEAHRGKGLGRAVNEALLSQPFVKGLRRVMLTTRDAHALYKPFGFTPLAAPQRVMELHRPNVYQAEKA